MKTERIYSKRLYIVGIPQGISGFRRDEVAGIVTGVRVRRDLLVRWSGKLNVNTARFRMNDGRLPEHQPVGGISDVQRFLSENPWSEAVRVG